MPQGKKEIDLIAYEIPIFQDNIKKGIFVLLDVKRGIKKKSVQYKILSHKLNR